MAMGRVGGERNFGYGKQMAWAGKNALSERYGDGHSMYTDVQVSREVGCWKRRGLRPHTRNAGSSLQPMPETRR